MGGENEQPTEVAEVISGIYAAIASGNAQEAQLRMAELEKLVPRHPELSRIRRIVEKFKK